MSRPQVEQLSPEQLSLAFLVLVHPKPPEFQIPPSLQHLNRDDWILLAGLLRSLELEREQSLVH
jgi:hypothetical protein